jgi:hypothetical protein
VVTRRRITPDAQAGTCSGSRFSWRTAEFRAILRALERVPLPTESVLPRRALSRIVAWASRRRQRVRPVDGTRVGRLTAAEVSWQRAPASGRRRR